MRKPPCTECPEKGCGSKHDSCESYQAWVKEKEEIMNREREEKASITFMFNRIESFKRGKKGGAKEL